MFLICVTAMYIGCCRKETDMTFSCDFFINRLQISGNDHRLSGKLLVISFLPYFFSQVDRSHEKDFRFWRIFLDLIQQSYDSLSDYICGCSENSFTVIGSQHQRDHIHLGMCFQKCGKKCSSFSSVAERIFENRCSSAQSFLDHAIFFFIQFFLEKACPAYSPR